MGNGPRRTSKPSVRSPRRSQISEPGRQVRGVALNSSTHLSYCHGIGNEKAGRKVLGLVELRCGSAKRPLSGIRSSNETKRHSLTAVPLRKLARVRTPRPGACGSGCQPAASRHLAGPWWNRHQASQWQCPTGCKSQQEVRRPRRPER